jgi:mono/diheme cytochrome c family protein
MKRSWWRTGPPVKHTQSIVKPSAGQLLRQIGVLLAVAAVWGGALLVLLGATRSSNVTYVADRGTPGPGTTGAVSRATLAAIAPAGLKATPVSFARDVLPIFTQICMKCHGDEAAQHGLVLKSYADVMQGSDNGPVVVPGDPANSLLVDMVATEKMPKHGPRLLPKQIRAIVDWVTAGAPDN